MIICDFEWLLRIKPVVLYTSISHGFERSMKIKAAAKNEGMETSSLCGICKFHDFLLSFLTPFPSNQTTIIGP